VGTNRVVAISGWKNSGKDTTADFLVAEYGYVKLSLAGPLKQYVAQKYGIPREWLDDRSYKESGIIRYPVIATDGFSQQIHKMLEKELRSGYWTPRALCILEGSIARSVYPNWWTRRVVEQIRANPEQRFVISDLRYRSEADTLRMLLPKEELLLVRLNRFDTVDSDDPSEHDLDTYTFDSTIEKHIQGVPELHRSITLLAQSAGIAPQSYTIREVQPQEHQPL
jgi:hypothetical protein